MRSHGGPSAVRRLVEVVAERRGHRERGAPTLRPGLRVDRARVSSCRRLARTGLVVVSVAAITERAAAARHDVGRRAQAELAVLGRLSFSVGRLPTCEKD
jgi:hypothetical protein